MGINFFRRKEFIFQDWLEYQGLANFVEMSGDWYPNFVRVFYTNLKVVNDTICSKVKKDVWTPIACIRPRGFKSHLGMPGVKKLAIYKAYLRNPDMPKD